MPNGSDCCAILQTEAVVVPTQWFVLDCTADGRAGAWLAADLANEIDYLHLWTGGTAGDAPKDVVIKLRPAALAAVRDAHERRRAAGSMGRIVLWVVADLADPVGSRLLAELPLDLANALFWKSSVAPAVVRAALGGNDTERGRFLSLVRDQYFGLPELSHPYYGNHTPGQVYGNEFDSTLLCDDDADLEALLAHLVPLHLEETRFARARLQRVSPGGIFVIENVMQNSLRWRKIDWLALTMYPFFKRLWRVPGDDVLDVLDYRRCPERERDPWAAVKGRSREKNWDGIGFSLDPAPFDPLVGEAAYRVTHGDHRTRLYLAQFLRRQDAFDEALGHCEVGRAEGGYEADVGWLKVEALARHGRGEEEAARKLFADYRAARLSAPDPSAEALDDAGSVALMEGAFELAYQLARRAVEKDRFLGHAYDTMVIAGRESGRGEYERQAVELASQHGMSIPIHVREKASRVLREAKVSVVTPPDAPPPTDAPARPKKWWQFWR